MKFELTRREKATTALAQFSESFPTITPHGLSVYLPIARYGSRESQFLVWPYCRLHHSSGTYDICIQLRNDAPHLNNNIDNHALPVVAARDRRDQGLWLLPADTTKGNISIDRSSEILQDWECRKISLRLFLPDLGSIAPVSDRRQVVMRFSAFRNTAFNKLYISERTRTFDIVGWYPHESTFEGHVTVLNSGSPVTTFRRQASNVWESMCTNGVEEALLLSTPTSKLPRLCSDCQKTWILIAARSHVIIPGRSSLSRCISVRAFNSSEDAQHVAGSFQIWESGGDRESCDTSCVGSERDMLELVDLGLVISAVIRCSWRAGRKHILLRVSIEKAELTHTRGSSQARGGSAALTGLDRLSLK